MSRQAVHVVFTQRQARGRAVFGSDPLMQVCPAVRVTAGVWLDLDEVDRLILKASKNKSRKAKDGALNVEVHTVTPIT